jgi:hypothetical protein
VRVGWFFSCRRTNGGLTMSHMNADVLLEDLARLDDGYGPAPMIGEAEADALVFGAMRRSGIVTVERCACSRRSGAVVWLRRSAVLTSGIVAVTTAAAALVATTGHESLARWVGWAAPDQRARVGVRNAGEARRSQEMEQGTTAQAALVASAAEPSAVQLRLPNESVRALAPSRAVASLSWRATSVQNAERAQLAAASSQRATSAQETEPAVDLLAQANRYRRQREYGRALRAYLDVAARYPNTRQAEAARITAADLRLEHLSDAKGAAEQYRAAASGHGQLGEEAAYGLVEAHRAAGRYDLEKRELRRFIARYPASPLAAAARNRFEQLKSHGR